MIPKITLVAIILGLSWLQTVCGAAYSKVYVQSGPDVVPVEYLNYGAPQVIASPQIAQISAPPVGSVLPLPNYPPCGSPCILPPQNVGSVAAVPANAKIITYNSPRVPVVVPAKDDKSSYEYSYVVYDENTGDRKAQRELSDGSVVHGEYSFIQPDGYVREVKYTADDLTGFNAIVKSFLPESVFGIDKKPETKSDSAPPCQEVQHEALKVEPKAQHGEPVKEEHGHAEPTKAVHEEHGHHDEVEIVPVAPHGGVAAMPPGHAGETPQEHAAEHPGENAKQHAAEHNVDPAHGHEAVPVHGDAEPAEPAEAHGHAEPVGPAHGHEAEDVHGHALPAEGHAPPPSHSAEPTHEHAPEPAHGSPEAAHKHAEDPHGQVTEHMAGPALEPIKAPPAESHEVTAHSHESLQVVPAPQPAKPEGTIPNGLVSYTDLIKCVQAAIANRDSNAPKPNISPLTYIILPSNNKPC